MKCSGCAADLAIPRSVWQWTCSHGHVNEYGTSQCSSVGCTEPRGSSASWPAMLCDRCHTVTTVPGSEMESTLKGSFAEMKKTLHGFIDPPKLFHCEHCNQTLVVPQGPWTCQACTQVNAETVPKCSRCTQVRNAQRVLCGHCHKATAIPESGLVDALKSGLASVTRMANKGWMDFTGQANVQCPSCHNAVKLPTQVHPPPTVTASATTGTVPTSSSSSSTATTAPVSTSALPPAPTGIPAGEWSIPLTCEACHHSFTLGKGAATGGVGGAGTGLNGAGTGGADETAASTVAGRGVDMQVALVAPPGLQGTGSAVV